MTTRVGPGWAGMPEPKPLPQGGPTAYRPLIGVPSASTLRCLAVSHWYVGYEMHYDAEQGFCIPCRKPAACHCDTFPMLPKWYAYMEVLELSHRRHCLLILPRGAIMHCPRLNGKEQSIRGQLLTVRRLRPGRRAPVSIMVEEPGPSERKLLLGEPCDLRMALADAWGIQRPDDGGSILN